MQNVVVRRFWIFGTGLHRFARCGTGLLPIWTQWRTAKAVHIHLGSYCIHCTAAVMRLKPRIEDCVFGLYIICAIATNNRSGVGPQPNHWRIRSCRTLSYFINTDITFTQARASVCPRYTFSLRTMRSRGLLAKDITPKKDNRTPDRTSHAYTHRNYTRWFAAPTSTFKTHVLTQSRATLVGGGIWHFKVPTT